MASNKERIDILLVEYGFTNSREKAKRIVMTGNVFVDGERVDKAGTKVDRASEIEIKGHVCPYVGRGGYKMEKAISAYGVDMTDKVAVDVGSSTGGFTDCMLQNGARKVFAVDVGYGQLDWKLRNDERVICMERTNARYLTPEDFGELLDTASIDVSFISLRLILPVVKNLIKEDGEIIALIKPQFEAGREKVGKNGVVRDKTTHIEVITQIYQFCLQLGLYFHGLDFSPIKGAEGNIEYLAFIKKAPITEDYTDNIIEIVEKSHSDLKK